MRRFIPTGVGNIDFLSSKERKTPVHPHRRGEHTNSRSWQVFVFGSSPQAWGTWLKIDRMTAFARFIPTGVGNMIKLQRKFPEESVHPHRRGEHFPKEI